MLPSPWGRNGTAAWPAGEAPTSSSATWGRRSGAWGSGPGSTASGWGWAGRGARSVAAGSLLSLLVLWTLVGNGLVCAAVVGCRPLRAKATNIFLASLAVADLLVALLVMPWKAAAEVAGYWPFGAFCRLWVACDILCSTASILNLCVIALERYWAVASPFAYQRRMRPRLALALAALAWALALLVSLLPVQLGWHQPPPAAPAPAVAPRRCDASLNGPYAVASSLVSFYIPVGVMLVAYGRIFRIAQGQRRRISSLERAGRGGGGGRPRARLRQEARALRTLALVLGAFVGCWLPFFVLNCLVPFCPARPGPPCVSPATFDLFVWLGWANSSLNPLIYASNADFRRGLAALLGCARRRRPPTPGLGHRLLSGHQAPLLPPPDGAPAQPDAAPDAALAPRRLL